MKRIIFATSNEGKMKEIRLIMADSGYEVVSLKEFFCGGHLYTVTELEGVAGAFFGLQIEQK